MSVRSREDRHCSPDLYICIYLYPRSRAGCDNCTKGVPIALTPRMLNRVASPSPLFLLLFAPIVYR
jgi:hypothetical protein